MKKLSEVSALVGISRRTLQEYDKIGLLKPTSKTESGYWLYDDLAIKKLMVIQIFREAGYSRKQINSIIESSTLDIYAEYNKTIRMLEEKRKRLDGMIITYKLMNTASLLTDITRQMTQNVDITQLYAEKSFSLQLDESIAYFAQSGEFDKETEEYMPFLLYTMLIGCSKESKENSKSVQLAVSAAYRSIIPKITTDIYEDYKEKLNGSELLEVFYLFVQEIFYDLEIRELLDCYCGCGATEYIIRAFKYFCKK